MSTSPNWTELTCTKLTQLHDALLVTSVSVTKLMGCRAAVGLQFTNCSSQTGVCELEFTNCSPTAALQSINVVTLTRVANNASCNWVNLVQVSSVQFGAVNTAVILIEGRLSHGPMIRHELKSCFALFWWIANVPYPRWQWSVYPSDAL